LLAGSSLAPIGAHVKRWTPPGTNGRGLENSHLTCPIGQALAMSLEKWTSNLRTYVDVGASRTTLLGDHRRRSLPPLSTSGPLALAPATSPFCDVVVPAQSAAAFTLRRIHDFRRHTFTQG